MLKLASVRQRRHLIEPVSQASLKSEEIKKNARKQEKKVAIEQVRIVVRQ